MASSTSSRARSSRARVLIDPSLRVSLVHLPTSLCSTLLARDIVAQTVVVELGTDMESYYCGWTGLAPSASVLSDPHAGECIVMSPSLADMFAPALSNGQEVSLRLFRSPPIPVARKVFVTPQSADDWEILSVHADEVESSMLSQVRAAKQGQVLGVSVGRSSATVIKFLVDRTVPPTRSVKEDIDTNDQHDQISVAVRLSTDTEVAIAPRPRLADKDEKDTPEQREQLAPPPAPSLPPHILESSSSVSSDGAALLLTDYAWRVLPDSYVPDKEDKLASSVVIPMSMTAPNWRRPSYELVALAFPQGKLTITKISCPTNPLYEPHFVPPLITTTASYRPGAMPNVDAVPNSVAWPERHVWIGKQVRSNIKAVDFDLVRFTKPSPGALREPNIDTQASQVCLTPPMPAKLVGFDAPLQECIGVIRGVHRLRELLATKQGRTDLLNASASLPVVPRRQFPGTSGLLLSGAAGSGKSTLMRAVGEHLALDPTLVYGIKTIDCTQHIENRLTIVRSRFKESMDEASWHAPMVLVFDGLDTLIPAQDSSPQQQPADNFRITQLARSFVELAEEVVREHHVFLVATVQSVANLHDFVRNARIWTQTVSLQSPEKDVRAELLRAMVHNVMSRAARDDVCDDLDFVALTSHTDGYHVADLHMLTERALQEAAIRCLLESRRISLTMRDFERAREGYTPIALRGIKLEQSSTEWADIGGLAETRHVLRETLEWPTKYAAIFANCPLRLRSGLLLYGFPGCGKTLLASAVAKECGLNFISVKGPEVLQKYVGASEKSVRDLFERAQSAKPCVLFFDEFESVAPKRGQDSNGVTDRVVNQLLTQMDGAEGLDGVYVLAATSRPDLIDAALLRPGRLDKALLCDMPKWEDRLDILRVVARKVPIDSDVDLDVWARRTEGFSGADLQALLYNAQLDAIHATLHATSSAGNDASSDHNQKHASQLAYLSIAPTKEANDDSHVALSNADKAALSSRLERILRSSQDPDSRTATLASTSTSSSSASASSSHSNAATTTTSSSANDRPRQKYLVTNKFMESSFQQTRPSVPAAEVARLRRIYAQFTGERDGKGLDAANMDAIGSHTSLM